MKYRRGSVWGKMKKFIACLVLFVVSLSTGSVQAATNEDMILLAQKGVSENIMIAYAEVNEFDRLSVSDILMLRKAGVPDKVIAAMLRSIVRNMPADGSVITERKYVTVPVSAPVTYSYSDPSPSYQYVYTYPYPYYRYSYCPYYSPGLYFGFGYGHRGHSYDHGYGGGYGSYSHSHGQTGHRR